MVLVAVFVVASLMLGLTGARAKAASGGRVVFVVMDRIGLNDIVNNPALPNITRLMAEGSTGLLMVRLRYDQYGIGGYTVIGAGGRIIAGDNAGLAFNKDELLSSPDGAVLKAGNIYRSRVGRTAPPGSVVNLAIEEMIRASSTYVSTSKPGLLGEALKLEGRKVAMVGNADDLAPAVFGEGPAGTRVMLSPKYTPLPPSSRGGPPPYPLQTLVHRETSCIAMDERGVVPTGDVSARLYKVTGKKTNYSTDFAALTAESSAAMSTNDFTVVDMGETSRVDERGEFSSDRAIGLARARALASCDKAIGTLMAGLDPSRDLLIVCSPTPSRKMISAGDLLTPLVIRGPGFEKGGTIRSETTRRTGLASNFDLAPTVLNFLNVKAPAEMEGQALTSKPGASVNSLLSLDRRAVYASNIKSVMTKLFAIPGLIFLGILLMLTLVRPELVFDHPYFWSVILLALMAVPLVYLLLPLMSFTHLYLSIIFSILLEFAIGGACLLACLARSRGREYEESRSDGSQALLRALPRAIALISSVTLVLVLLDPVLGSPMIALSPFGAGLIAGGRFYGIGNIYMGVAFGAAILIACLLPSIFPHFLRTGRRALTSALAVMLITVFVVGYPRLGANVGAIITGIAATVFIGLRLRGTKIGWKQVLAIVVIVVLFLALMLLIDLVVPGSTSHAGKAITRIQGNGVSVAISEIARKVSLNWKLLVTSIWRLFFFVGVVAAIVWARKYAMFSEVNSTYAYLETAWPAFIFAMIVALMFKDTGVESVSAMMLYYIVPAFLLFMAGRAFQPELQGRKAEFSKNHVKGATMNNAEPEAT